MQRQVEISGKDATKLLELLTPRPVSNMDVSKCLYIPMVNQKGCMINDPVLLKVDENILSMTGTDLEVEMIGRVSVNGSVAGSITVPARKLVDICKEIPENASIEFSLKEAGLEIRSGRFRSTLSTLPVDDFPSVDHSESLFSVNLDGKGFKKLL